MENYYDIIGYILGLYGVTENKMETTIIRKPIVYHMTYLMFSYPGKLI